jgi:NADPH:quinone reductase
MCATPSIHGTSSSVDMAAVTIAKDLGVTVFPTTRQPARRAALPTNGADHVVIDDGAWTARTQAARLSTERLTSEIETPSTIASHAACWTGAPAS